MGIILKSASELALMRQAGSIVARVLRTVVENLKAGIRTNELDIIAEEEVRKLGGVPSFKGYRGYPASLCVSINDEIVHGIPGQRCIKEGDIVSLQSVLRSNNSHTPYSLSRKKDLSTLKVSRSW